MTVRFNVALRDTMANALAGILGYATLTVYTGAQPASAENAPTGAALVTFTLAGYAMSSGGSAVINPGVQAVADASGAAGWGRFTDGANVVDGTVGTSGTDFILSTGNISAGGTVTLTSATITQPG